MSRPSSRNAARPKTPVVVRSFERPEAKQTISKHLGTVLEDGLDEGIAKEELSSEQFEAARAAFKAAAEGQPRLGLHSVRRALLSLNLRLDDALFQRLVESRWDAERGAPTLLGENGDGGSGKGVDFDGFARIYQGAAAPATKFGRHLRKAAGRGEEELVRELVLRGCNPNTGSGTGETALHCMAAFGQVECAKALKALCGKELILQPRDKAGWTPLMVASGNGHTAFMRFLLDEGVDPGIANNSGRTAMHRAAARGRDKALKLLISKKLRGQVRLHGAASRRHARRGRGHEHAPGGGGGCGGEGRARLHGEALLQQRSAVGEAHGRARTKPGRRWQKMTLRNEPQHTAKYILEVLYQPPGVLVKSNLQGALRRRREFSRGDGRGGSGKPVWSRLSKFLLAEDLLRKP